MYIQHELGAYLPTFIYIVDLSHGICSKFYRLLVPIRKVYREKISSIPLLVFELLILMWNPDFIYRALVDKQHETGGERYEKAVNTNVIPIYIYIYIYIHELGRENSPSILGYVCIRDANIN